MTEHAWLADAIVRPAFDGPPLLAPDAVDHGVDCAECRTTLARIRSDGAALAALDPGAPAPWVRRKVLAATTRQRAWRSPARLLVLALVTIGVAAGGIVGVGALSAARTGPEASVLVPDQAVDLSGKAIVWRSKAVALGADEVTIEANGVTFRPGRVASVHATGDPGNLKYATLELTWVEAGIEERLNLYLQADATQWSVSQIGTYDNRGPNAEFANVRPGLAPTPLGQPFRGDIDVMAQGGAGPVHTRISGAVLAFTPQASFVDPLVGGGPLARDPFEPGGPLHCSGILQLTPVEAERELLSRGIRLSWRFEWKTGPNTGYGELRLQAPPTGWISRTRLGGDGELIVFVEDPARPSGERAPFPPECPAPSSG
jgi:hypothetical protein